MATLKEILGKKYREDMTLADIIEATKEMNLADLSTGQYVSYTKFRDMEEDRDNFKSQYLSTLTESQRAEAAALEKEQEYAAIKRENAVNRYSKKLAKLIDDEGVLDEVANLMADGKFDEAEDKKIEFISSKTSQMKADFEAKLFRKDPEPHPQGAGNGITKEQFDKMGYTERVGLLKENPDLYNQLNNN